jgi:hypothetical protein
MSAVTIRVLKGRIFSNLVYASNLVRFVVVFLCTYKLVHMAFFRMCYLYICVPVILYLDIYICRCIVFSARFICSSFPAFWQFCMF